MIANQTIKNLSSQTQGEVQHDSQDVSKEELVHSTWPVSTTSKASSLESVSNTETSELGSRSSSSEELSELLDNFPTPPLKRCEPAAAAKKSFQEIDKGFYLSLKTGYLKSKFTPNLRNEIHALNLGTFGDILATPLELSSGFHYGEDEEESVQITDLALDRHTWCTRIVLTIDYPDDNSIQASERFRRMLEHAIYLGPIAIVINCTNSDTILLSIASIVNDVSNDKHYNPTILFRFIQTLVNNSSEIRKSNEDDEESDQDDSHETTNSQNITQDAYVNITLGSGWNGFNDITYRETSQSDIDGSYSCETTDIEYDDNSWTSWNNLRNHLSLHAKLGLCLYINENFIGMDDKYLERWTGEPVRFIIVDTDQFVRSPDDFSEIEMIHKTKQFIKRIFIATSYTTALLVSGNDREENLKEFIIYLDQFVIQLTKEKEESTRILSLVDHKQTPLQPLSTNLRSSTYSGFELDHAKYIQYQKAMMESLRRMFANKEKRSFNVMVLGAGRGPLVDRFIAAIRTFKTRRTFKIYVLDKNPSAIESLKYKQANLWANQDGLYETEIVFSDMRDWNPGCTADLIISELLGSFGDNELSPECIDGVWKYSTKDTISIPQQYTSFLGPVSYHSMYEMLLRDYRSNPNNKPFDQMYVVDMANYYKIDEPQPLFEFKHFDLHYGPESRDNKRYAKVQFWSKVDTVCHGFAGYFTSKLFDSTSISIVPGDKTPNMDSWFPAFFPLEQPVEMPKGTKMEVHFWRKESASSVWYEWALTSPVRTRIYSPKGVSTAMSKIS